jgi:hypothetical protein
MRSRLLKTLLWAVVALVLGYIVAISIGLVAFEVFEVSQREGAAAMGLAFVISPFVAVVSSFTAAIWCWIASGRGVETPASSAPNRRRILRFVLVGAAGMFGWYAGTFLQWILAGRAYDSFVLALLVTIAPWLGLGTSAATAWWILRRPLSHA